MSSRTGTNSAALVALPRAALFVLRRTLLEEGGSAAASFLQESGFAGGDEIAAGFESWLASNGYVPIQKLDTASFSEALSGFFAEIGWGTLAVTPLNSAVAALDSEEWWESADSEGMDHPSCHLSAGLLTDLLGRVSSEPLAVLEVECRSMGSPRCRFLTGSTEALERVFEDVVSGMTYEDAVARLVDAKD